MPGRQGDGMKKVGEVPAVDVAAVLIVRLDEILAVYNDKWGAFTFPMSKIRPTEVVQAGKRKSAPDDGKQAAIRTAAEWLGRTITEPLEPLRVCEEFMQSERDGRWKRYRVRVFRLTLADDAAAMSGTITEWLKADDFLDENRGPISPTARHLIADLQLHGNLP